MSLKQTQGVVRYSITSSDDPSTFIGKVIGLNSSGTPALGAAFAAGVVVNTERPLGSTALQLDVALIGSGLIVDVQLASSTAVTVSNDVLYADSSGTFTTTAPEWDVESSKVTVDNGIAVYPLAVAAAGSLVEAII